MVAFAIMLAMPRAPGIDVQAQMLATRLDQALDRDPSSGRVRVAVLPLTLSGSSGDDLDYLGHAIADAVEHVMARAVNP